MDEKEEKYMNELKTPNRTEMGKRREKKRVEIWSNIEKEPNH